MHWLIFLTTVVLLSGCTVGTDYHRPKLDVPQSFRYEEKDARVTANADWWETLRDPVLDSLIAEALANNLTGSNPKSLRPKTA